MRADSNALLHQEQRVCLIRLMGAADKFVRRRNRVLTVPFALVCTVGSLWAEPTAPPLPVRPIHMKQGFNDCIAIAERKPGSAEARSCFADLVPTFVAGRNFQCGLWAIPTDSAVCRGEVKPPEPQAEERWRTLQLAEAVAQDLAQAANSGQFPDVTHVAQLLVAASHSLLPEQRPYSLVSQGGVSLGSWQAGYLYLVTEVLKQRATTLRLDPEHSVVTTATGASAGAVNALAYGVEGCRRAFRAPEETLGFKVWVEQLALFGTDEHPGLFDEQNNPLALFNDKPIERALELARAELVNVGRERQTANPGAASCSFNLGFVTTHMKPRRVPVHVRVKENDSGELRREVQMTVPRLTERFILEVGVNRHGVPFARNLEVPDKTVLARQALPNEAFFARLGRYGTPNLTDLLNGVRASGAFPLAFSPVWLDYQTWDVEAPGYRSYRSRFVDGGTLDNTPIGLAAAINRAQPFVARNPWFADLFSDPSTYLFVNPGVTDWNIAPPDSVEEKGESETMLSVFGGFTLDLLNTGFEAQLMNTAEALPFVREDGPTSALPRLTVPQRHMPIAGEQLVHFLAFAERDFREFDFVVGMADARVHLKSLTTDPALQKALLAVDQALLNLAARPLKDAAEPSGLSPAIKSPPPFWTELPKYRQPSPPPLTHTEQAARKAPRVPMAHRYKCMRAFYAQHIEQDDNLQRLTAPPEECRNAANPDAADNQLRLLRALVRYRYWARSATYDPKRALYNFIHWVSEEGFTFPDTVQGSARWWSFETPEQALRGLVDTITARLASKHSVVTGWALKGIGRVLADNSLFREFPAFNGAGVADNGVEGVFGWPLVTAHERFALRLDANLRAYRWRTLDIAPNPDAFTGSLALSFGPTFVWGPFLNPGTLDFEFGGGLFGEARPLPREWALGLGYSAHVALVAFQRLYLMGDFQHTLEQQLDPIFQNTHVDALTHNTWGLSAGWRFDLY